MQIDAVVPEGAIVNGHITVISYLEPGHESPEMRYSVVFDADLPLSSCLGLLELAKADLIERCQ